MRDKFRCNVQYWHNFPISRNSGDQKEEMKKRLNERKRIKDKKKTEAGGGGERDSSNINSCYVTLSWCKLKMSNVIEYNRRKWTNIINSTTFFRDRHFSLRLRHGRTLQNF